MALMRAARAGVRMMDAEKIMFYASHRAGMLAPLDAFHLRLCDRLVSEGFLRREEKTVIVPAMDAMCAGHAESMGLDPSEHEATIVKYFAIRPLEEQA